MNDQRKFTPVFITGRDLDDTWFQLLQALHDHGRRYEITSGSYEGSTRLSFDFVAGAIQYPHSRPLAPRIPEGSPLPPPTTDAEIEKYFVEYLMNSNLAPNEEYRYSTWIVGGKYEVPELSVIPQGWWESGPRTVEAPNQIEWIIKHFNEKGLGNEHCYLTVGYPESNLVYDQSYKTDQERGTSPCLRGLDFRVVDGMLTTHVIYRSWDLVSGWPTNMGGFTLLNEYVAGEIDCEPGPLTFSCKSLHAYEHALEFLEARLGKNI
jgi:thymidylate synthase